jgi:hypothetical protein
MTTLVHSDVYEEVQYQNPEPIGPQLPIPYSVHDIELSWDRDEGYMRIIIEGQKWWFKELLGKAVLLGADNERGRLLFQGEADLSGETLTLYRAPDALPHPIVEGLTRRVSDYRTCYRRLDRKWRARDEKMPWNHPDALVIVEDVVGDFAAEWRFTDNVAHIFAAKCSQVICAAGCFMHPRGGAAHLYDSELVY